MADNALALPDPIKYNVLVPTNNVMGRVSPWHVLRYTEVQLDVPNESYHPTGTKAGQLAPLKAPLARMMAAAAISQDFSRPMPNVPMTRDHFIWQVGVSMEIEGRGRIQAIGSKEWQNGIHNMKWVDFKDHNKGQVEDTNATANRVTVTETKALLRAVRQILGLKGTYTEAELKKGFQVPHLVYQPDLSDSRVLELEKASRTRDMAALYPSSEENVEVLLETSDVDDEDPIVGEVVDDEIGSLTMLLKNDVEIAKLMELADFRLTSASSPFNGATFREMWNDYGDAGKEWFPKLIEWGKSNPLDPKQEFIFDHAQGFYGLVVKNGGWVPGGDE